MRNSRFSLRQSHMVMQLLRCLWVITASFDIHITAIHLPGIHNNAADMLSRDQGKDFLSAHPKTSRLPTTLPLPLLSLLSPQMLDWTSIAIIPPPLHRHTVTDPAASSINTDLQLIYIYKNNSKIMILKRGVGINHCYKSRETRWKHALPSNAIKSKETRWRKYT